MSATGGKAKQADFDELSMVDLPSVREPSRGTGRQLPSVSIRIANRNGVVVGAADLPDSAREEPSDYLSVAQHSAGGSNVK